MAVQVRVINRTDSLDGVARPRNDQPFERTRKGRSRYTASLFSVPRGLPLRAAHVKR